MTSIGRATRTTKGNIIRSWHRTQVRLNLLSNRPPNISSVYRIIVYTFDSGSLKTKVQVNATNLPVQPDGGATTASLEPNYISSEKNCSSFIWLALKISLSVWDCTGQVPICLQTVNASESVFRVNRCVSIFGKSMSSSEGILIDLTFKTQNLTVRYLWVLNIRIVSTRVSILSTLYNYTVNRGVPFDSIIS